MGRLEAGGRGVVRPAARAGSVIGDGVRGGAGEYGVGTPVAGGVMAAGVIAGGDGTCVTGGGVAGTGGVAGAGGVGPGCGPAGDAWGCCGGWGKEGVVRLWRSEIVLTFRVAGPPGRDLSRKRAPH